MEELTQEEERMLAKYLRELAMKVKQEGRGGGVKEGSEHTYTCWRKVLSMSEETACGKMSTRGS